ncbi:MAG: tetratricopeptide repeat protein [Nitrospinae bacterium]|nr:tetratricopeptide repeat protein [Nitrospinota bacterium]
MSDHKILVVDDDPTSRKILTQSAKKAGHIALEAQNSKAGLKTFKQNSPISVVVSNHMMPDSTGEEFLEKIKLASPNTVRVMVTAADDLEVMEEAINRGELFRFLKKPINVRSVKETMEAGIRQYEKNLLTSAKNGRRGAKASKTPLLPVYFLLAAVLGGAAFYFFAGERSQKETQVPAQPAQATLTPEEDIPRKLEVVRELVKNGEAEPVIQVFNDLVELHPNDPGVAGAYAEAMLDLARYDDAMKWANKALEIDPKRGGPYAVLGRVQFEGGDLDKALGLCREAIRLDPKMALAYRTIGNIYLRQGRYKDGLTLLQEADRINPDNSEILTVLSSAHIKLEDYPNAIQTASRAAKLNSENPGAYFNLALAYYNINDGPKALDNIRTAEKLYQKQKRPNWTAKSRATKRAIVSKFHLNPEEIEK